MRAVLLLVQIVFVVQLERWKKKSGIVDAKPVHVFYIDNHSDSIVLKWNQTHGKAYGAGVKERVRRISSNEFTRLAIPSCGGYSSKCRNSQLPYNPPKCLCFYDKYGILCRPRCKRVMLIKKWKTYLPVIPQCEKLQNEGLPIVCTNK